MSFIASAPVFLQNNNFSYMHLQPNVFTTKRYQYCILLAICNIVICGFCIGFMENQQHVIILISSCCGILLFIPIIKFYNTLIAIYFHIISLVICLCIFIIQIIISLLPVKEARLTYLLFNILLLFFHCVALSHTNVNKVNQEIELV